MVQPASFHLFIIGFVTLLAQVVILREVLVASFGSELVYVLGFGLLMFGTAAGAAMSGRGRPTEHRIAVLFTAFALLVPLLVALLRAQNLMWRATPGAFLTFGQQLAGMAMALVPLGALGGLLFAAAARLYVGESRTLAAAYAIESSGGLAGGAISTILIAAGIQNFAAALLCAFVAAAAAVARSETTGRAAGAVAAVLFLLALPFSGRIDRQLTALNHPQLLASRDTPYGRATIAGSSGQIAVFENDAFAYEDQGTSAEEFVHVAALQVEKPQSVLVLGGAIEGMATEVAKHGAGRIVDVEVDRKLVEIARAFLRHPPADLTFGEPRQFLQRAAQYDLILSAMPEPDSGQASRFYTREFFALCAARLSPGGVFAFRLRSAENLWTAALTHRTASIVGALRSAFRDVIVLPGTTNIVIASNAALERDPGVLAARFRARAIQARLVSPQYLRYVYTNDRVAAIAESLARTQVPANSDQRPVCYHYTLVVWLSRFFPSLANRGLMPLTAPRGAAIAAAALLTAIILACRRSMTARSTLLVAFAGFAGIVLESTLVLAYQISEGILYRDLGILLTMFMAGLAIGSWWMGRRPAYTPIGMLLLLGVGTLAALTAWRLTSSGHGLASCALFLFAAGALSGAVFAYASRRAIDQERAVAPLYAADLAGGVVGSIAASVYLIPMLGLPGSVLLVGALALIALLLA